MFGRTATDPRVGALLEEVVGIRRQLEEIGRTLTTDDDAREGLLASLATPQARTAPRTGAHLGAPGESTGQAPQSRTGSSSWPTASPPPPRAWTTPGAASGPSFPREPGPSAPRVPSAPGESPSESVTAEARPSARRDLWSPPGKGGSAEDVGAAAPAAAGADAAARPEAPPASGPTSAAPTVGAADESGSGAAALPRQPRRTVLTPERLLAIGGALVTILGVGFLLAVAIAAGIFGPVPRVVSLALLTVALGAVAARLRDRAPDAAVALAATSSAAAFGVVVAMTTIYGWLPASAGIVAALVIAGAGVFVAHRWGRPVLAGLSYAQVLLVLPMVLGDLDDAAMGRLTIFATIAFLPIVLVVVEHRWMRLYRFAAGALLLVALVGLLTDSVGDTAAVVRLLASLAAAALVAGVATALGEVVVVGAALGVTSLTVLGLRGQEVAFAGVSLDSGAAAVLALACGIAAWRYRARLRAVLTAGAVLHLFLATVALPASDDVIAIALAFEGLVLLLAARSGRSTALWCASLVLSAIACLRLAAMVPLSALFVTSWSVESTRWEAVVVGVLVAAIGAAHTATVKRIQVPKVRDDVRTLVGVAFLLYGASSAVVAVGLLPGASETREMGAAVVTTVIWVAVAVAMILRPASPVTRAGYLVLVAAVAKLFLIDLHAVDGILRAVLFVLTGLALIGASSQIRKFAAPRGSDARG